MTSGDISDIKHFNMCMIKMKFDWIIEIAMFEFKKKYFVECKKDFCRIFDKKP